MIRDITIGQYYAQDSSIHKLDSRTKLMGVLIYIVALFLVKNPWWYLLLFVVILALYRLAKVPYGYLLRGLKGIVILLIFTFVFRLISTPGIPVAQLWIFTITGEGITKAISLTVRIALMIIGASLLSYTSTPRELADGLEKAFGFLEKIHVPIHDMAVIVMIAVSYTHLTLPTILRV